MNMLKSTTGKLYLLFSACMPDNVLVKKRLQIAEICEMPEYKALKVYKGATELLNRYYSSEKMQLATCEQLEDVKRIIPILEDCIRKLYDLVCYGDVRKLRKIKDINYYSFKSIDEIYRLVSMESNIGINITNILEEDVLAIFDNSTVLSIDDKLDRFDSTEVDTLESAIMDHLSGTKFCISAAEIYSIRKEYRDIYRQEETIRLRMEIVENKIFVKKILLSLLATFMVCGQYFASEAGLTNQTNVIVFIAYILFLTIYWILG